MKNTIKIGDKASLSKVFTEDDVIQFAKISKDMNPIHLDKEFAASYIFGQRIVHGMLVASLFSGLLGKEIPGEGAIYLRQDLIFKAPVLIGEEVTASVEVKHIREDKHILTLQTVCTNYKGDVVIEGEAVVKAMMPRRCKGSNRR